MSTTFQGPPTGAEASALLAADGPSTFRHEDAPLDETAAGTTVAASETAAAATLASLHVGARLVLRCRKDWRVATVASSDEACVCLNVASPTGHTYRVRRPPDAALTYEGAIPLLGEVSAAGWRAALARYDARW